MEIRLVFDGPNLPGYNMAADESMMLLHSGGVIPPTLRLWRFSESVVALGRYSRIKDTVYLSNAKKLDVGIIRRFTGGGVTYNDSNGEINWSFVSAGDSVQDKYIETARAIGLALSDFGIKSSIAGISDIAVDGKKIAGLSAARSRNTIIVHGTLLINPDLSTMNSVLKPLRNGSGLFLMPSERVSSINEIMGRKVKNEEIYGALIRGFSRFGKIVESGFSNLELDVMNRLYPKYTEASWTFRR